MNSSISSSSGEVPAQGSDAQWKRWLVIFVGFLGVDAVLLAVLILLDPFSTGRLTPITQVNVATKTVLLGHAARARDPRFDAAIVGNSHAIPLDPQRIGDATQLRMTQLASAGIYPTEQFIIGRAFARHHRGARAMVVVLDELSCKLDQPVVRDGVFPKFLFEGSNWDYLQNIIFPGAASTAARRLVILAGLMEEPGRVDGFEVLNFSEQGRRAGQARALRFQRPTEAPQTSAPPPAFAQLETLIQELKPETALVLYFVPLPAVALPVPDSPADRWLQTCKERYRLAAAARPRTAFVDRMVEDSFTRNITNFEDIEHIRNELAPILEKDIVEGLRSVLKGR